MTAALAFGAANAAALAPSSTPTGDWTIVGGAVKAVARSGDAIYLGGKFQGLARHAPGLAAFDPVSGDLEAPAAQLDKLGATQIAVTAITAAPDGGVYVAGAFAGAGGVEQPQLLRLGPSGALDPAFAPQVAAGTDIADMDVGANGVLYLAGRFTSVGGQRRTTLAAVDAATGALKAWQPATDTDGLVAQVEVGADAVYIGGSFANVRGVPRSGAAAVSLDSGAVLPWQPAPAGGAVAALALDDDRSTVYLGGAFTEVGAARRTGLAAVDATGTGTLRPWNPAPSGTVTRMVVSGSRVFVAGSFRRIGAQTVQPSRPFLAAIDATTGEALAWEPLPSREPSDLAVHAGHVYMSWKGGSLPLPRLAGQPRCGLASIDAVTGTATPWDPSVEKTGPGGSSCNPAYGQYGSGPAALIVAGGRVWAGGGFTVANVRRRTGLAALDARTGQPLAWAPRLPRIASFDDDIVHDLAPSPDGSTIYVGGRLGTVNDQTRTNAAALKTAGAADTVTDLTAWNPAPDGVVRTLAPSPDGRRVYLGGDFTRAGSRDRPGLAAVGTAPVPTVAEPWRPNPDGPVHELLVDSATERLFVGGQFRTIARSSDPADRVERAGLAAVDVRTSLAAPQVLPWNAELARGARVEALALRGTQLVAGGGFATTGESPANLAAFDLTSDAVAPWSPQVNGLVQTVTIDPADGTAYVTGTFSSVGGERRAGAAAVGADGAPTGWDPAPSDDYPQSGSDQGVPPGGILLLGDRLLLTGAFTVAGGRPQAGFALFGPATAPVPRVPPTITGELGPGETLTCRPGSWGGGGGTRKLAWLRDGDPITGATGAVYTTVARDVRRELRCRETMTNAAGSVVQVSSPVTVTGFAPALDSPPTVAGQPWVGGSARCTTGLWANAPTSYTFRWFLGLGEAPIAGAVSATYEVTAADEGQQLACEVTAKNDDGASPAARSPAVTITEAPPAATGGPLISGDPRVGSRLTCEPGAWERARGFAYQWLRDRVPLVDAAAPTYVATSRDLGKALTCLVSADNAGGTTSAESFAVVVVASTRSTGTGRRANPEDDEPASTTAASRRRGIEISSVRLRSGRTLAVTVSAPAAGRISLTVVRGTGTKARGAKKKATTLARGSRTVRRAARVTLQVKLSPLARRLVARAGRRGLRVTVRVSFRPAQRGAAGSSDGSTRTLATRAPRR